MNTRTVSFQTRADITARAAAAFEEVVGRAIVADHAYDADGRYLTFPNPMSLRILPDRSDLDRWPTAETCVPLYHVAPFGSHTDTNAAYLRTRSVDSVAGPSYRTDGGYRPASWHLQPTVIEMIRRHTRGQSR